MKFLLKSIFAIITLSSVFQVSATLSSVESESENAEIYEFQNEEEAINFIVALEYNSEITPKEEVTIDYDENTRLWNLEIKSEELSFQQKIAEPTKRPII